MLGANAWAYGVLGAALVVASITDIRSGKIYNWLTLPTVAIGLIGHTLLGGLTGHEGPPGTVRMYQMGLTDALAGLAVGYIPMVVVQLAGGIGGGDAKMMAGVGALAGWRFALAALLYGLLVAAVMAIILMLRRRIVIATLARTFRFLVLALVQAKPPSPVTAESPKVPFGLALCIGSAAALVEMVFRQGEATKFFWWLY